MTEKCIQGIREVENSLRDLMNWIAVFAEEYDLPEEAKETLYGKIEEIAKKAGEIACE